MRRPPLRKLPSSDIARPASRASGDRPDRRGSRSHPCRRDRRADDSRGSRREHSRAVADEHEAAVAIEAWHADQLADIRASVARTPGAAGTPAGDVLSREQSAADWCRIRGHGGFDQPVSFSRYLKGLATGDWSGAEHERALSEGTP